MGEFLDSARDLVASGQVRDQEAAFRRVFGAIGCLQAVHSKASLDLTNIESVFTALELGSVIQRVPGVAVEEISKTVAALKILIVKTLEERLLFPGSDHRVGVPPPYGEFARLLNRLRTRVTPTHSVSVITFNYDLAVDIALFHGNLGPDYVIDGPHVVPGGVEVMKLHGSLNWATETGTRNIKCVHLGDFFRRFNRIPMGNGDLVRLPLASQLQRYFKEVYQIDVEAEPVIVPPTWNKTDYHSALTKVWARAAQHLSEAQYIFVCGYSLPSTDSFFRHLYALGTVGPDPLRKFYVYDPDDSGRVNERFRELLGTGAGSCYRYIRAPFNDAIAQITGEFPGPP
jgi:hypothetical protein